ncbi:MAG: hypothetical protein F6K62_27460, partial [Sphaerospermopsis sp. SIO1G2]|nr:hypothetical protein [Sphaerospermopsis sp. SIO1G2]
LGDNLERLVLVGDANINGTGNGLNNNIVGNGGINHLYGGGGNDYISGQGGDDTLIGGAGNDFLFGGDGRNTFRFLSSTDGIDRIGDFKAGTDTIQIVANGFEGLVAPSPIGPALSDTAFISGSGITEATNSHQRFIYNNDNGALFFDADGSGAGFEAVRIATLTNLAHLSAGDIFLI